MRITPTNMTSFKGGINIEPELAERIGNENVSALKAKATYTENMPDISVGLYRAGAINQNEGLHFNVSGANFSNKNLGAELKWDDMYPPDRNFKNTREIVARINKVIRIFTNNKGFNRNITGLFK